MATKVIFFAVLTFSILSSKAQDITHVENTNTDEISLLNSIRRTYRFTSPKPTPYALQIVESAYIASKPEITGHEGEIVLHRLFVSIKEISENESLSENNYIVTGDFYNPRDYAYEHETHELSFLHGIDSNIKSTILVITPKSIEIK